MYNLREICKLFHISQPTLYRWCRRAHITPHIDPADYRRRNLDDDQVIHLARSHCRVVAVDTGSDQLSAIAKLEARIAELEKKLYLGSKGMSLGTEGKAEDLSSAQDPIEIKSEEYRDRR
jgi:hypothetical protein